MYLSTIRTATPSFFVVVEGEFEPLTAMSTGSVWWRAELSLDQPGVMHDGTELVGRT